MPRSVAALAFLFCATAATLVACGGSGPPPVTPLPALRQREASGMTSPVKHVVIVIQENRSFDNFFATFPGADGTTTGKAAAMPASVASACKDDGQPVITQPTSIPLTKVTLTGDGFKNNFGADEDLVHIHSGFETERDQDKMDGFDLVGNNPDGSG
ncbi:MAG TPA: alkaline phosphatase family protein, partial [Candidatus Nitrosotalea sp.]|nr:alkaline phosphatase family protein [Candidatus Nitrosotalea sp.]